MYCGIFHIDFFPGVSPVLRIVSCVLELKEMPVNLTDSVLQKITRAFSIFLTIHSSAILWGAEVLEVISV